MNAVERLQMELSIYGIQTVSIQPHPVSDWYCTAILSIPSDTNIKGLLRCIKDGKGSSLRNPNSIDNQDIKLYAHYNDPHGHRYVASSIDKNYYHLPDLLHDLGLIANTNN